MTVADDLYDEVMELGKTIPLADLRAKYDSEEGRAAFRYNYQNKIVSDLATLPLSGFVARFAAIDTIIDAFRDLYGADNVIVRCDGGDVHVSRWESEEKLRAAWPVYAEREYQLQAHGGEK